MQAQDIRFGEELFAALGDFKAGRFGAAGRAFAPPADHPRAKGFADRGDDTADLAVSVDAEGLAADANTESRLPLAFFEPPHFTRQTAQRRKDQSPSEFSGGVRIARTAGRHDDSLFRASFQVDMGRRPAGLTDQF